MMSRLMDRHEHHAKMERYYEPFLREHGATAKGLDWKDTDAQERRFPELLRIVRGDERRFSLIDYGCGYGALAAWLEREGYAVDYQGFDVGEPVIELARETYPELRFTSRLEDLEPADYAVASGVFTFQLEVPDDEWTRYLLDQIHGMDRLAGKGFAFNMLTKYSDPPLMRDYLHYADPGFYFDYCKRTFSRNVALLHDYDLYEFTILVRK